MYLPISYESQVKSETQHLLESFITFAQNQFQTFIKTIRVDNELEFISMRNFFIKKVLNVNEGALLFQSHLLLEFWKCVLTATYIINSFTSPLLKNKSSLEMIYNHPPSLSHLKT